MDAEGINNQSADKLTGQLDGIQQATGSIATGNHSISAIRSMLANIRTMASQAMRDNANDVRSQLGEEYNQLLQS